MNISDAFFDKTFAAAPVMVVLRGLGPERALELSRRAWDAGVASVEIPIQTAADEDTLRAVVEEGRSRGLEVGAGTILTTDQVELAQAAGAAYLVSPGLDRQVVWAGLDAALPFLPGVATASEVQAVRRLGLRWCKVFPAGALGPGWFRAMRGPFPDQAFVATGGVDLEAAGPLLAAGARAVSLGSALDAPADLERLRTLLSTAASASDVTKDGQP